MTRRFSPAARALLAASALTLTAFMASVAPAAATPDYPLDSADPRAKANAGNAVTCKDAGLAGDPVIVDAQIDESNTFVQITDVPSDVKLTGIVVKGGPAYNVYGSGERLALHAPLNPGGNIPRISHWFACGQQASSPTDIETSTDGDTSTNDEASDEEASDEEATSPAEKDSATDEAVSDAEAQAGADAADDGNGDDGDTALANTGFAGHGLLLGVGGGLLVVGIGLVLGVWALRRRVDDTTTN